MKAKIPPSITINPYMMKYLSRCRNFLLFALLYASPTFAQDILWEKSYGGKQADYLFDVQPTPDSGFILAGSSFSRKSGNKTDDNIGDLDYWLWKMDEKGNMDWQKSFGGSSADMLQAVQLTSDGGFILAGTSNSAKGYQKKDACFGKDDIWILKLDAKGNEQWQRTLGGEGQELLACVVPTKDGGYILGGSSASQKYAGETVDRENFYGKADESYGNLDYWVIKLGKSGKVEWQKTIGGEYDDILKSIVQAQDGNFVLGGNSNSFVSGNKTAQNYGENDFFIVWLDSKGDISSQKTFGGEGEDQICALRQLYDGNIVAAGNSFSGPTGNKTKSNKNGSDFWLIKFTPNGDTLWQETYNIGKTDLLTSLVENDDNTLLLGGYAMTEVTKKVKSDREDVNDYIAIKVDEKGSEKWTKSVGSAGEDILRKVIETRDGGYVLAGTSTGAVSRDKNSGIGNNDFWVVKLKDKEKPKDKPVAIEAYPNPTDAFVNVVVGYEFEKGTATLFDISGRMIQTIPVHDRIIPFDLSELPQGVYLVQVKTEKSTDAVKIIKAPHKN
jgi:hypothetical protein